jgi:hypothetical protein
VEVQGHADQQGPEDFNQKLSENRAKAVLEFMVKHNVDRGRLSAVGFGASRPLVEKTNERALFLNRRVEFAITREHPTPPANGAPPANTPATGIPVTPSPAPTSTAPSTPAPAATAPTSPPGAPPAAGQNESVPPENDP